MNILQGEPVRVPSPLAAWTQDIAYCEEKGIHFQVSFFKKKLNENNTGYMYLEDL